MQIQYLDGPRLRRSLVAACEYAQMQRGELNRINVFPVPDGDTGTNLALTVRAISDHLRGNRDREISRVAREAAQAAVLGARGNCGMMLSHFLLGFSDRLREQVRVSTAEFGAALAAGAQRLRESLEQPVEGTILTVISDTAVAADASGARDFVPLMQHLVSEAQVSLARTPDLLPVLKKAGVVDAGAKGFVSLLEGVLHLMDGSPVVAAPALSNGESAVAQIEYPADEEQYRFCTEALVEGEDLPTQKAAREALRAFGDSLIVIRSGEMLKIHVHTDEPEAVFAHLRSYGTLVTHKAEDMQVQHQTVGGAGGHVQLARRPVTVVTDSASDLPEAVVRAHGIHVAPLALVDGDRTYRDGIDITAVEFHERLHDSDTLPTTSQPPPAAFLEVFRAAAEEGESVVGVLLGSTLSGTYGSGEAAAAQLEDTSVHLVDSLGASLLQGLLVLKATELAELGRSPQEIVDEVSRVRGQSGILFTAASFERMVASGRIGKGPALLGRLLGLKPILGLTPAGRVVPFGRAFGVKRARAELLRCLRLEIPADVRQVRFGVVHVGAPDIVPAMSGALRAEYGSDVEILHAPATPVIATHLGIGAWGIAYMVED